MKMISLRSSKSWNTLIITLNNQIYSKGFFSLGLIEILPNRTQLNVDVYHNRFCLFFEPTTFSLHFESELQKLDPENCNYS